MAKTKKLTFSEVMFKLIEENNYEHNPDYALDYFSGSEGYDKEPRPYDDFYAITTFGGCECIYTDFYVIRESDGKRERIATAKTLSESDEAYIKMHELGARVSLELIKLSQNSYKSCTTSLNETESL